MTSTTIFACTQDGDKLSCVVKKDQCDSMINTYSSERAFDEARHEMKNVKHDAVAHSCDAPADLSKYSRMIQRQLQRSSDDRVSFPKQKMSPMVRNLMMNSNDRLRNADRLLEMNTAFCTDYCGDRHALCPVNEDTTCFLHK